MADQKKTEKVLENLRTMLADKDVDLESIVDLISDSEVSGERREIDLGEIAARESEKQSYFFGEEINFSPEVFEPHRETIARITSFGLEPHVLLPRNFDPDSRYPGLRVFIERQIYSRMEKGELPPETIALSPIPEKPILVMVDTRMKPNYKNGQQMYDGDQKFVGKILSELRGNGVIPTRRYIDRASRYAVSWMEIHRFLLPEVARLLGLDRLQVRLPRLIEFIFLSNCFYPQWYQGNTWEWFEDVVAVRNNREYLFGGKFSFVSMSASCYTNWGEARSDRIGFRPIIILGEVRDQ